MDGNQKQIFELIRLLMIWRMKRAHVTRTEDCEEVETTRRQPVGFLFPLTLDSIKGRVFYVTLSVRHGTSVSVDDTKN